MGFRLGQLLAILLCFLATSCDICSTATSGWDEKDCLLPKVGKCYTSGFSYYYDHKARECKQMKFGRCNGNKNNFSRHEECVQNCMANRQ